jgi:Zn-dependent protease with chaperone function
MPLLLLLLLYLACLGESPAPFWVPSPPLQSASEIEQAQWLEYQTAGVCWAFLLTWFALLIVVLAGFLASQKTRRRLRFDPQARERVLERYSRFRFYHLLALFIVYGLSLYVLGWGWAVKYMCTIARPEFLPAINDDNGLLLPAAELLLLAPLLVSLVLSWTCFYDAERALYDSAHPLTGLRPFWSRSDYVGFHIRQNLAMVLVPVFMLIVMQGAHRVYPALFSSDWFQILSLTMLLVLIACLPWLLRLILGLHSMPAGELRDRLMAAGRRLNFRCSDIMLWNTRNGVANALVVGLLPSLRYVVLSDRLLADLTADEVEAVFGHEAGHVKHHHMLYYLGFLFLSLFVLATAFDRWVVAEQVSRYWLPPLLVGSLGAYIFVFFGFLSRRCERQADIHGCRAVSCGRPDCADHDSGPLPTTGAGLCPTGIRTFVHALEKVAALNGISRSKPGWLQSWQHSTIDRRVKFLQEMLADPTLEPRFQRRVGIVKWVLMIALVAVLGMQYKFSPAQPEAQKTGAAESGDVTDSQTP